MTRLLPLIITLITAASVIGCYAAAQDSTDADIRIDAPGNRLAAPGEFVTLVFRVSADKVLTVQARVSSLLGWRILRQPGDLELEPGKRRPIAVTVEVPGDAAALTRDRITLELLGDKGKTGTAVEISVTELTELKLNAPREVVIGKDGFTVTVENRGNVTENATLTLLRVGQELETHTLELAPQEERKLTLTVSEAGSYNLELISERGGSARAVVNVIRFGVPPPEPLLLGAEVSGEIDSGGALQGSLAVTGPLSDFLTLDAELDARNPRRSFAELEAGRWTLRLGKNASRPFQLELPGDFGVQGSYQVDSWSLAGAAGWLGGERFSGYAAGNYRDGSWSLAGGVGMRAGSFLAAARAVGELPEFDASAAVSFADGRLGMTMDIEQNDSSRPDGVTAQARLQVNNLLTSSAGLAAELTAADDSDSLHANLTLPLGPEAPFDWRIGIRRTSFSSRVLPSALPGQLSFSVQAGYFDNFGTLQYRAELAGGWQTRNQFGVLFDDVGFGLSTASSWTFTSSTSTFLRAGGRLTSYPLVGRLDGLLEAQLQTQIEAFTLSGDAEWNLGDQELGLSGGAVWQDGPWRLTANLGVRYRYADSSSPVTTSLSLTGGYAFRLTVPEKLVTAAGGRHLGIVGGAVLAGDRPLPDVEVRIGRFRVLTDEQGRYRAELEPGDYRVRLELATLPVTFQPSGPVERELKLGVQQEVVIDFPVVETAALEGRILLDSDANGVADDPPKGSPGKVVVSGAEGFTRVLLAEEDGSFQLRGLLPGTTEVFLQGVPKGNTVVGESHRQLELSAGEVAGVTFLVQPAVARARSFSPTRLRIRRVEPEVERVPPGTAPLVRVTVQGEPEGVSITTSAGTIELTEEGGSWSGRVPVPADAPAGILRFTVKAHQGEAESSRRGQLVVDDAAPALELTVRGPVRPGEMLEVALTSYFAATSVVATSPFVGEVAALETAPGRWRATLAIPGDAADDVYTVTVTVTDGNGVERVAEGTFRVLAP